MSNVRSEPLKNGKKPAAPPLSRTDLDRALPWFRILLGAIFIAYSSLATIDGVRVDCGPLCATTVSDLGVPLWVIVGVTVAALLSLGQWFTSERWPWVYIALILVDARYTQWWVDDWALPLAQHHVQAAGDLAWMIGLVVSWFLAIGCARFGEVLLFGTRKKEASDD